MQAITKSAREDAQDVWYGQIVTIVGRWFLIGAGLLLTFWRAETTSEAILPTYLLVGLIAMNFLMHGRFIVGSPMRKEVVLASCIVDVGIISLVILTARWDAASGLDNPFYIFYYPVILGFALVFPWRLTMTFAALVIAIYAAAVFLDAPFSLSNSQMSEPMIARLVTLGSTAVLGNMFWRIQRQWRRAQLASAD